MILITKGKNELGDSNGNGRLRLLLAEDTPAIRDLIYDVLQSPEIEVVVAKDGAEAFSLFCRERFDVVVTDVRMPVLNGRLATKLMRIFEENYSERDPTPIIAISANATDSDREACFIAGVNAFVSKPIDFESLVDTIDLLTDAVPLRPITVLHPQLLSDAKKTDFDKASFDRNGALKRLGNDEPLLNQMISLYQSDQQELLENIRSSLEVDDLDTAARHAHSLKGLAATIGGTGVAKAASVFSNAAKKSLALSADAAGTIKTALEQLEIANAELLKQFGSLRS